MSFTSLVATVTPVLSESAHSEPAVSPLYVGLGAFVILAVLLLGVLVFGAGRDHT